MTKNDVFISYSHTDVAFATQLASRLGKEGLNVWIDLDDIPPGENWRNSIDDGLKTAHTLLLLLSAASIGSSEVQAEWNYFLDEKKTVIPILLQSNLDIPSRLRTLQRIDFSQTGDHYLVNYAKLRDALKGSNVPLSTTVGQTPYTIKSAEQSEPSAKEKSSTMLSGIVVPIVVAIIGLVGTIAAALVSNQSQPTQIAVATATVQSSLTVLPTDSQITSQLNSNSTPSPQAVPLVTISGFDVSLIFNGKDSFIVQANGASNISGLGLRSVSSSNILTDGFPDLELAGFVMQAGECLIFKQSEDPTPPDSCKVIHEQMFVPAKAFWYDDVKNRVRDLAFYQGDVRVGICSAANQVCDFKNS